jgi:hypothetical protein
VTNFKFPSEVLQNGKFELRCFDPYWSNDAHSSWKTTAEVVACTKADKCPDGNKYYAHLSGTLTNIEGIEVVLFNEPVIHDGATYNLSCWINGAIGLFSMSVEGVGHNTQYNATGKWLKISETFTMHDGDDIALLATYVPPGYNAYAPYDWKVIGCEMSQLLVNRASS